MKNKIFYKVLSVDELKKMLRVAKQESIEENGKVIGYHTIVLKLKECGSGYPGQLHGTGQTYLNY